MAAAVVAAFLSAPSDPSGDDSPGSSGGAAAPAGQGTLVTPIGGDAPPVTGGSPSGGQLPPSSGEPPPAAVATPLPEPSAAPRPRVGAVATPRLSAVLDVRLERLRAAAGIPGVSATIIFADGSSWTGAAGMADVAAGRPVAADTAFAIASISKTFTAALVLQLAAEGRLSLDDAAADHLGPTGVALDPAITVRMLLDHTSGLHDYFLNPKIDAALRGAPAAVWPTERTLSYVGKAYFAPGRGWRYSNTNYLLLGLIAEKITGTSFAELLRTRFFEPLGLDTAFTQAAEPPRGPISRGYRFAGPSTVLPPIELSDGTGVMPFTSVVTASGAAGSIAGSSRDVALWAWSLYRGAVLPADSLAAMIGGMDLVAGFRPPIGYGLGVQGVGVDRFSTLGHSGRLLGFRASVRYLPDEGVAIAVLTNQSRADPGTILLDLLRAAVPASKPCGPCIAAE